MLFMNILKMLSSAIPLYVYKNIMVKRFGHIGFELTNVCNANCTFCAYRFQERDKVKISDNNFNKVLKEYVRYGGGNISFSPTVGDPLVDKNIVDKIKQASSYSEIKQISLYTNGILLKKVGFNKILNSGLTQLSISTYIGSKEKYKKYYGVDKYDLVMSNVLNIAKINSKLGFPVNITLHLRVDINNNDWKDNEIFEGISQYIGDDKISYLKEYDNWGGKIKQYDLPNGANIEKPLPLQEKIKAPCFELYRRMHILSNGNVGCCVCRDIEGEINIGNIEKNNIRDIWQGNKLAMYRERWTEEGIIPKVCDECTRYEPIDSYINENRKAILLSYINYSKYGSKLVKIVKNVLRAHA